MNDENRSNTRHRYYEIAINPAGTVRKIDHGKDGKGVQWTSGAQFARPPHSPTPVRILTVSGAAGAKAVESKFLADRSRQTYSNWN